MYTYVTVFGYSISHSYSHFFSFLLLQDSCHQELLKSCTWRAQSAKVKINLPPSGCYFYRYAGCYPSIQGQGKGLLAAGGRNNALVIYCRIYLSAVTLYGCKQNRKFLTLCRCRTVEVALLTLWLLLKLFTSISTMTLCDHLSGLLLLWESGTALRDRSQYWDYLGILNPI